MRGSQRPLPPTAGGRGGRGGATANPMAMMAQMMQQTMSNAVQQNVQQMMAAAANTPAGRAALMSVALGGNVSVPPVASPGMNMRGGA